MLKNEEGLTLLELVIAIVVLAVGLTGVLGYFTQGLKDSSNAQNAAVATVLAQDLMEEIRSKCWDETATTSAPCNGTVTASATGTDGGETRATYDDVDDFNGLSNTPPKNSQGGAMPSAFDIFTQSAAVCYVAAADLNTCAGGTSNYKKITVTISWGSLGDQVQLVSVAANK
jgi:MSHA pilin protein MshD